MTAPLRRVLISALVLALAGCGRANMAQQPKAMVWDQNSFFPDQSTMRQPVPGTEPRDEPNLPGPQPAAITEGMLARGRQRYDIFCSPCHGLSGDGAGMIVQRGFPAPPRLDTDALVHAKAVDLYDVITNGHGVMYGYADRVPPADRWAIIAYIRALQLSQRANPGILADADRAALAVQP